MSDKKRKKELRKKLKAFLKTLRKAHKRHGEVKDLTDMLNDLKENIEIYKDVMDRSDKTLLDALTNKRPRTEDGIEELVNELDKAAETIIEQLSSQIGGAIAAKVIITAVIVSIIIGTTFYYLADLTIYNEGCDPVPVSIPGVPFDTIYKDDQESMKIPRIDTYVDARTPGKIYVENSLIGRITFNVPADVTSIKFNNMELLGEYNRVIVDDFNYLDIICGN